MFLLPGGIIQCKKNSTLFKAQCSLGGVGVLCWGIMPQGTTTGQLFLLPFLIYFPLFYYKAAVQNLYSSLKVTDINVIGNSSKAWIWHKLFSHRHSRIRILTPQPEFSKNSGCQTSWQTRCLTGQWTTTHAPSAGPRWKSEHLLVKPRLLECVCVFLFFILFVAVANVNSYFVRFLGCEDHENYFTNTQRQRIVSTHSKCFLMTGKIKNMLILIFVLYFGFWYDFIVLII